MNFNGHFNFFRRFIGIYQRILIFFSFSFNLSCIYKKISAKLYLSAFFIEISALLQFFRRICKFIERSWKNISFSSFIGVIFEDFGENPNISALMQFYRTLTKIYQLFSIYRRFSITFRRKLKFSALLANYRAFPEKYQRFCFFRIRTIQKDGTILPVPPCKLFQNHVGL